MKKQAVVLAAAVAVLVTFASAQAADKFGYVDLSRIFSEYGKTKEFDKVLTEKEKLVTAELKKKADEIKQLGEKFEMLGEKEKTAKKAELDGKIKSFEDLRMQKGTDLRKEQDEKMKEILKDIEDAVKLYAEKEGFTMVFNDRVLVYQAKSLDITDKVMETLNKGAAGKK
jgi:outer membrane protein